MPTATYILNLLFSTIGISAIVIYLGKRFIDKSLELGVEKFKSSLNAELETHKSELLRQTEVFKAQLRISELEHQIKYSTLHEERAKTIKDLYSLLIDLQTDLNNFTTPFQGPDWSTDKIREDKARESVEKLKQYFLKNRIYFTLEICNNIDSILKLAWEIYVDMSVTKSSATYDNTGSETAMLIREWRKHHEKVNIEIHSARLELEKEFRKLIGVE